MASNAAAQTAVPYYPSDSAHRSLPVAAAVKRVFRNTRPHAGPVAVAVHGYQVQRGHDPKRGAYDWDALCDVAEVTRAHYRTLGSMLAAVRRQVCRMRDAGLRVCVQTVEWEPDCD